MDGRTQEVDRRPPFHDEDTEMLILYPSYDKVRIIGAAALKRSQKEKACMLRGCDLTG